jgi:hypothetical protein
MIKRAGLLDKYFYFFMSLLIAAVVVHGFSHTVDKHLIHAAPHRPFVLYLHASIFSGWVIFFILQSVLVRTHNARLHRLMGWFGVTLGVAIPVMGISAALTMARFNLLHFHSTDVESGLMFSFFDMAAFSTSFALGIYWRKKPELHRRLLLTATCALTSAAFARFPPYLPFPFFYPGVDLLILLGVARDLIVNRRIHRVYLYALPAFIIGQVTVMYTCDWPYWIKIAHAMLR